MLVVQEAPREQVGNERVGKAVAAEDSGRKALVHPDPQICGGK